MRSGLRAVGALGSGGEPSSEPVALEIAVAATGARPGDSGAKRQLFTEETQTVLVFERGAVIRLSAAVADGQLLFLTNKKTGKEVVTQVKRKRSFRPTSCYVDLEFTEASPGFWGIEFPKTAPAIPGQISGVKGEEEAVELAPSPAAPSQQEVERLKNEVAELQSRLKSLTVEEPSKDSGTAVPSKTDTGAAAPADAGFGSEATRKQAEEKILQQLLRQEAEQERPAGPARLMTYPAIKMPASSAKKGGKAVIAGGIFVLVGVGGFAAYHFGLLDSVIGSVMRAKGAAVGSPAAGVPAKSDAASSAAAPVASAAKPSEAGADAPSGGAASEKPLMPVTEKTRSSAEESTVPTSPDDVASPPAGHAKSDAARTTKRNSSRPAIGLAASTVPASASALASNAPAGNPPPIAGSDSAAPTSRSSEYIAPKLIHAVKPGSPPVTLRNYISGNVHVDALVDVTGHVQSVTVLSGPAKLRNTAIDVMKQYVYEPARQDGKPVASHVQTSLQFWYAP